MTLESLLFKPISPQGEENKNPQFNCKMDCNCWVCKGTSSSWRSLLYILPRYIIKLLNILNYKTGRQKFKVNIFKSVPLIHGELRSEARRKCLNSKSSFRGNEEDSFSSRFIHRHLGNDGIFSQSLGLAIVIQSASAIAAPTASAVYIDFITAIHLGCEQHFVV